MHFPNLFCCRLFSTCGAPPNGFENHGIELFMFDAFHHVSVKVNAVPVSCAMMVFCGPIIQNKCHLIIKIVQFLSAILVLAAHFFGAPLCDSSFHHSIADFQLVLEWMGQLLGKLFDSPPLLGWTGTHSSALQLSIKPFLAYEYLTISEDS